MRIKTAVAIAAIALVAVIAFSVTGQEEPLPAVTPKPEAAAIPLAEPSVVLTVEPIRPYSEPTLVEAARNNDFVTFDALYTAAKQRGEDVSQFATLHDLWIYSVTDPIGAFYGRDLYERLSRAYPGYAAYIADYRIVDSRGNVFYPTSETRAFLLDRVIEGRTPRVVIASSSPRSATRTAAATPRTRAPRQSAAAPARRDRSAAKPVVSRTPQTAAAAQAPAVAPPVEKAPAAAAPTQVASQPAPVPQAVSTPAPATIAEAAPPAATPATSPAPSPVTTATPVPADAQPSRPLAGRGVLLLFIGLIGIGLLAVILRTPREEPLSIVHPPQKNNVEPLRKPPQATPPPPDTPRKTGSHG